ncbi:hypothetical protein [Virgibacillus doumboii]|uniref:hypothetical protein n=1 Tax=Virgibacillus doumboii TaxID=2697503 RepID=UPI0013DF6CD0|nr:hypothetical protein [Virgibacillus doumboii]
MKPLFVTTATGALLLYAGGAVTDAGAPQLNKSEPVKAKVEVSQVDQLDKQVEVQSHPEFEVLDEQVDSNNFEIEVVENNEYTRVINLTVQDSNEQYKSVYVKETNVLKIIDLDQGLVFRGVIEG